MTVVILSKLFYLELLEGSNVLFIVTNENNCSRIVSNLCEGPQSPLGSLVSAKPLSLSLIFFTELILLTSN